MRYLTFTILLLTACSGAQRSAESPDDSDEYGKEWKGVENVREESVTEIPVCVDENNDPIQCEDDSECCEGFACGYDPEGSTRIKTCLWMGER